MKGHEAKQLIKEYYKYLQELSINQGFALDSKEINKDHLNQASSFYESMYLFTSHISSMAARCNNISDGKAMRWLGYIQGVLHVYGFFSLAELKKHGREICVSKD